MRVRMIGVVARSSIGSVGLGDVAVPLQDSPPSLLSPLLSLLLGLSLFSLSGDGFGTLTVVDSKTATRCPACLSSAEASPANSASDVPAGTVGIGIVRNSAITVSKEYPVDFGFLVFFRSLFRAVSVRDSELYYIILFFSAQV